MSFNRRELLAATGLLTLKPRMAMAQAEGSVERRGANWRGPKKVYAHWHWFPTSFDNRSPEVDYYADQLSPHGSNGQYLAEGGYIRERPLPRLPRMEADWPVSDMSEEIEAAHAIGLNGFQFNIGGVTEDSAFVIHLRHMLEAAKAGPIDFEIALSLDALILKDTPVEPIIAILLDVVNHPNVARHADGRRIMLGAFAPEIWEKGRWRAVLDGLSRGGVEVFFVPTFLDYRKTFDYADLIDGASMWGVDRPAEIQILERVARQVKAAGKTWASVVWPQDFRPHNHWFAESGNSELFRKSWESARAIDSDIVNICTWNDYSEGSEIRPSTSIQYAFYDLAAYYIEWFKTNTMPAIKSDLLYYFHRIESADADGTGADQPFRFFNRSAKLVNLFSDPTRNEIELLAFLTEPGKLEIAIQDATHTLEASAGITSFRCPLVPGKPRFRLIRGNKTVISFESAFDIREHSAYQDLLYHGGSSSRSAL
jgi:hypothetical protein